MSTQGNDFAVGSRIREYEILELLGRGGMGAVYRVRHVYLDEERAIKVVRPGLAEGANPTERFIREARILVKLRHPNLVQLFEFGTLEGGSFFMVMELIRGESVLQRIGWMKRIPIDAAISIIREAALGLGAAHAQGVVHRDIAPDNLLLVKASGSREVTKVIDFGIAKPLADEAHVHTLSTTMFIGKPQYSSPEQCGLLEPGETIDHRSDIYSLGVTLYQMVTGKLPFYATTPQGYLLKHASEAPAPPSSHFLPGQFPSDLDAFILRALSKRRQDRHASMDEFLRDLEDISGSRRLDATSVISKVSAPSAAPRPGSVFAGRFQIEREIGHGGMGTVYQAIDKILGVPVAIKVMSAKIASSPTSLERLKREVILARKVAHPNACRIFDIGEHRAIHYVTMEFVEGRTLWALLRAEGRLPASAGVPIVRQVLRALQEAHRVGVVHRDLKPQNIMVDDNQRAYIMDFGLSITTGVERLTQVGAVVGTPSYMAPEQHEDHEIDHRADLYAIGVIMFEIFTGRLPFVGQTPVQVLMMHMMEAPPKPSSIAPDIAPELERIILKLLEKKPADRFQTAGEILQVLEMTWAPTETTEVNREVLVHRMMIERKYSQAIKMLGAMLGTDPGNPRWKKLLQTAMTEKALRDVRRARRLMREGNLEQASAILAHLSSLVVHSTRVKMQITKVRDDYAAEVDSRVTACVREVEVILERGEIDEALKRLEPALRIQKDNPRVVELRGRIDALQLERVRQRREAATEEAAGMLASGKDESALVRVEQILKTDPAFAPALDLKKQIEAIRADRVTEQRIREKVASVAGMLESGDLGGAGSILAAFAPEAAAHRLGPHLRRLAGGLQAAHLALTSKDFAKVQSVLGGLVEEDPEALVQPHRKTLETLIARMRAAIDARERYRGLVARGKELLAKHRWEDAASAWRDATAAQPDEQEARTLLREVEARLQNEDRARAQVVVLLADCERLLGTKNIEAARKILSLAEEALGPQPRLENMKSQTAALMARLQELEEQSRQETLRRQNEETARLQSQARLERALEEARSRSREQRWDLAVKAYESALEIAPGKADVLHQLQAARENAARVARTRSQLGAHLEQIDGAFRENRWDDAIRHCSAAQGKEFAEFLTDADRQGIRSKEVRARSTRISEHVGAAVDLLVQENLGSLRPVLEKLAATAAKTEFERDALRFRDAMLAASQQIGSRDFDRAMGTIQQSIMPLPLARPHGAVLGQYVKDLEGRMAPQQEAVEAPQGPDVLQAPEEARWEPERIPDVPVPAAIPSPVRRWWPVAAAVLAVTAVLVVWLNLPRSPTVGPVPGGGEQVPGGQPSVNPPPIAGAPTSVSIDAIPWAYVVIRPVSADAPAPQIPEAELTTPCSFTLPEGDYALELSNDGVSQPLVATIQVRSGQANAFVFPMPGFDPRRLAKEWSK
ncbi:MAG: protein kinase [Acidobacteria bacterium]|nr:protein kinase [Acidobacteriota bacterium]